MERDAGSAGIDDVAGGVQGFVGAETDYFRCEVFRRLNFSQLVICQKVNVA